MPNSESNRRKTTIHIVGVHRVPVDEEILSGWRSGHRSGGDGLKQMIADPEYLPKTYTEWKRNTKKILEGNHKQNIICVKMEIDLQELEAGCKKKDAPLILPHGSSF